MTSKSYGDNGFLLRFTIHCRTPLVIVCRASIHYPCPVPNSAAGLRRLKPRIPYVPPATPNQIVDRRPTSSPLLCRYPFPLSAPPCCLCAPSPLLRRLFLQLLPPPRAVSPIQPPRLLRPRAGCSCSHVASPDGNRRWPLLLLACAQSAFLAVQTRISAGIHASTHIPERHHTYSCL